MSTTMQEIAAPAGTINVPNRMLHRRDLAEILGVGAATVTLWVRTHKLPTPIRVGRKPLWRPEAIRRFLEDGGPAEGDGDRGAA